MYRLIVVGHEGGSEGRDALALAGVLADPGARVIAAHVHPFDPLNSGADPGDWGELLRREAESRLAGVPAALEPAGAAVERRLVPSASAARGLHGLAEQAGADLLVLGSTRHGTIGRVLLGSTAESLFRGAPCAAAVAPRGFAESDGRSLRVIGVGYDGSPESDAALAAAEALALERRASLRVITAVEPPTPVGLGVPYGYADLLGAVDEQARARLDGALERTDPAVRPAGVKRRGDAAAVLADEADVGLDLLVVGSRGYGPVRRAVLGSVSAKLTRLSPCPVLVVPRGVPARPDAMVAGASGATR